MDRRTQEMANTALEYYRAVKTGTPLWLTNHN